MENNTNMSREKIHKSGEPITDSLENKSKEKEASSEEKSEAEDVPNISFFTLYRFADCKDKTYVILGILFSVIASLNVPLEAIVFGNFIENMIDYAKEGSATSDKLLEAAMWFTIYNCIIGSCLILLSYGATVLMNLAAYRQVYRIRQEYLGAVLNQDFAYFDTHKTGDFASKMTDDVVKLEDGIGEMMGMLAYYMAAFAVSVGAAIFMGWKLALLCMTPLPISFALVGSSGWIASKLSKREIEATGKAGAVAEEVLSAVRTVYAFGGQRKELDRYQTQLIDARTINIMKGLFTGLSSGCLFFCIFAGFALSFYVGTKLQISEPENYTVSTIFAVFLSVMNGSQYLGMAPPIVEVIGIARGAGAQIFHVLDNKPSIDPLKNEGIEPLSIQGNIELKNVVFHYPTRPDVPESVSLSIKRGQSVALVGHSGCGKSTIIQLISRCYDATDGNVLLDGNEVRTLKVRWLRAQIGLVGQEPVLFNTTVRENIRYGREDATDKEIEAVARQANAHQFIIKLPKGYGTLVGERGASLSGGQKQRIAIARALVRNPKILLLDEATSALDTASEAKVQEALDKAQEGRTTIIVAHRLSTVRNVDVIYVFKKGKIIEIGNHTELMKNKGPYYELVMAQESPECEQGVNLESKPKHEESVANENIENEDEVAAVQEKAKIESSDEEVNISFWQVLPLNFPEWKSIMVASIAALINGIAYPMFAIFLGDLLQVFSTSDSDKMIESVKKVSILITILGAFVGASNFIMVFAYAIAGAYLTERMRVLMFKKILEFEIAYFDDESNSTGALCAKLSGEAAAVQGATGQRIGSLLQAASTLAISLILSFMYEWRIGLTVLIFAPFIGFILYKEGKITSEESSGTAKTMEASSKVAVEAVANVRTVASLGREDRFKKTYAEQLLPALKLASRAAHWRGLVFGVSRGIFSFAYAAAFYHGALLMVNNGVTYDDVFKSSQALLMGAATAAAAFAFAPNFRKGIKAAGRIMVLLERESKITDPEKPAIENFVRPFC